VLGVEIEQTVRGACALLGHWSHDIGGFWLPGDKANKPPDDLFLRWVQFGALSPVFRLHSDHGVREPWLFESGTLRLCREAMRFRMKLIPQMEAAEQDGLPLWRPMCFAWPREEDAYAHWRQAMLGDDLLFAPVWREDGQVEVWFPPGTWRHLQFNRVVTGPLTECWKAAMEEIPLFLREPSKLGLRSG
jgi:alpha-D-xyloside xylohydrolase